MASGAERAAEPMPPLWLTVPARAGQLPGLRRALREWMALAGVGEADATAVQIAVGEATTNAVEHAYAGREAGLVRLVARLDGGGTLSVQVIDGGSWRQPRPAGVSGRTGAGSGASVGNGTSAGNGAQRGRGFALMRSTMDEVDVRHGGDGTTVRMRLELGRAG